jgi:predicted nucleic acid-binding protein
MTRPPRAVLDTNVAVSAPLFHGGRSAEARRAWQAGRFVPVVSRATAAEPIRLPCYPKFKLGVA